MYVVITFVLFIRWTLFYLVLSLVNVTAPLTKNNWFIYSLDFLLTKYEKQLMKFMFSKVVNTTQFFVLQQLFSTIEIVQNKKNWQKK